MALNEEIEGHTAEHDSALEESFRVHNEKSQQAGAFHDSGPRKHVGDDAERFEVDSHEFIEGSMEEDPVILMFPQEREPFDPVAYEALIRQQLQDEEQQEQQSNRRRRRTEQVSLRKRRN